MYFYSQTGATVPLKPKSSCHAVPNQICGSGNLWWYSKGGKRQHLDLIYLVKLGSRVHSRVGSRRVLCFKKSLGNCCLNKIFVFLMHEKNTKKHNYDHVVSLSQNTKVVPCFLPWHICCFLACPPQWLSPQPHPHC